MAFDKILDIDFPLRGFLPKQFESYVLCRQGNIVLYSGAFRAGKTILLDHISIATALEYPKSSGLLGALTETRLSSVVFRTCIDEAYKYQDKLDKAGINLKIIKNIIHSDGKRRIDFTNGSTIYFRACDDERKLSGYTLDYFGLDEAVDMDESIFSQLLGRISGTGCGVKPFGIIATNPASQIHWLYKYFYIKPEPNFKHVDTNTRENRFLPDYDNFIKRLERSWDRDWILRYLDGNWTFFSGAIYKDFNPERHMGDYDNHPVEYHIAGVDWGLRDPFVILVGGITSDNRFILKKEYYGNNKTSNQVAKLLSEIHENKWHFKKVYCDPSAADLILQAYTLGVPIAKRKKDGKLESYADRDIPSGIARMQSLFKNDAILIDKRCNEFRREHLGYRYAEGTDKPIKNQDDHTCDAARYITTDFNPFSEDSGFDVVYWNIRSRWI